MFVLLFAVALSTAFLLQYFKKRFVCSFEHCKCIKSFFAVNTFASFFSVKKRKKYVFCRQ